MKIKQLKVPESGYAMLAQAASMGGALLVMLMLVRVFPKEVFGQWVLFQSLVALVEMTRMGMVQNGLVRFVQSDPKNYGHILSSGLILHVVLGSLLWGLLMVTAPFLSGIWDSPLLIELSWYYSFTFFTLGSLRFMEYVQMANNDFRGVMGGNLLAGLGYAGLVAFFLLVGWKMTPVMALLLQGVSALLGIVFVSFYRGQLFRFKKVKSSWIRKLGDYGKFSLGTNLSSTLLQRVDVAMIAYFISPGAVAIYNIASKAPNYMEISLKGGAQYFFPRIAAAYKEKGSHAAAQLYTQALGMMLAINLPLCIFVGLMAEPILWVLGGESYLGAWPILCLLLFHTLIKPFSRMFGTLLDAIGRPEVNFRMVAFSILINVGMNLLFVPPMGALGAALGTILSMIVMNLLSFIILKNHMPLDLRPIPAWIVHYYKKIPDFLFKERERKKC